MLACGDGSLYTGMTNDLRRRMTLHAAGRGAKYTRSHPPQELAGLWRCGERTAAARLEYAVKTLPRAAKLALLDVPEQVGRCSPRWRSTTTPRYGVRRWRTCWRRDRMVDIKLYAAPMEGLTTYIWRRAQREVFGGVDKYFTPFLSPSGNLAFQQKELDEVTQGETDTVPQLLTNRGDYFVWAARELYAMGVREVNFNLGCPSGTVTAKHKGAGLLAYPEELDRCLEEVFAALPDMRVSIKTRIGKNDPAEWERLLAIYGKYPVSELIVHPRVQKEFYRGAVHRDAFELALARRREPPVYNGDLFTVAEAEDFCRQYPQVRAVMLGRGLVADPALGRRLRGGAAATRQELETFHHRLLADYRRRLSGDTPVLHRMRELWNYLSGSFDGAERELKAIRKARTLAEYQAAAQRLLGDCPLRENAVIET